MASTLPAAAVACIGIVAFGAAKRVERSAAELLASGCRGLLDSAVDGMVQGLLVDEASVSAWNANNGDGKNSAGHH